MTEIVLKVKPMTDTLQLMQMQMTLDCTAESVIDTDPVPKDGVLCKCCGETFTLLKRHLKNVHDMDETHYRRTYSIPSDEMLVSVSYATMKRRCIEAYEKAGISKR